MKKYTILLATIILAFAACNKEAPTPRAPERRSIYFPRYGG